MSLRRFFRRAKWDAERRQELDAYLQIEIDAQIERGVDPVLARARAPRTRGNTALIGEGS
jgi:hypothetical protein